MNDLTLSETLRSTFKNFCSWLWTSATTQQVMIIICLLLLAGVGVCHSVRLYRKLTIKALAKKIKTGARTNLKQVYRAI